MEYSKNKMDTEISFINILEIFTMVYIIQKLIKFPSIVSYFLNQKHDLWLVLLNYTDFQLYTVGGNRLSLTRL